MTLTQSEVAHAIVAELTRRQEISKSAAVEMLLRREAVATGIDPDDPEKKSSASRVPSPKKRRRRPPS